MLRCGKLVRGESHPRAANYTNINVSSASHPSNPYRSLSPMVMTGSFEQELEEQGMALDDNGLYYSPECFFENWWQGAKVYKFDMPSNWVPPAIDEVRDEKPLASFFRRREVMMLSPKPKRRPIPKAQGCPIASYMYGKMLGYVAARKRYCWLYEQLILDNEAYINLQERLENNENLLIIGPDGRNIAMIEDKMIDAFNDTSEPFGHELVLCCLLQGWKPWTM